MQEYETLLQHKLIRNPFLRALVFKLMGGAQCYRDHGAGYTVRRALYHVGLWRDEEAPESPENRPKLISGAERFIKGKREKKKG